MLCKYIHLHNSESINQPIIPITSSQVNCPDSPSRNKAKNALSLAEDDFSRLGSAKIDKISFGWRKKKQILHKSARNTVSIWRILVILRREKENQI
jgi:hypothetical protein